MGDFNFKNDITWRIILVRLLLVVATASVIVWFMPRSGRANFKIEQGKPWRYNDLTAPFDFPILKSDSAIQAERDSAMRRYEPYYNFQKETGGEQVRAFMQKYSKGLPGLTDDYKSMIANRLSRLYNMGIVDTKEPAGGDADTLHTIRVVTGKRAVSVRVSDVFTLVQAYEELMGDPAFSAHREALQQLALNNYLTPNLLYDRVHSEQVKRELQDSVVKASGIIQRGQKIIDRGTIVDDKTYLILESFVKESDHRYEKNAHLTTGFAGRFLYVLLLIGCFTLYLTLFRKDYFDRVRSVTMLYTLIILFSLLASLLVEHNLLHVYILPMTMVPIFVRVFMDSRTASMAFVALVLIVASLLHYPLEFVAVELVSGMVAVFSLRELSSRSQLFWTALLVTAAGVCTHVAVYMMQNNDLSHFDIGDLNYLIVNGIMLFCSYPLLYIVERLFGFISDITLVELSDMNKVLLRRMSEVAPGTFQHSIQVANLSAEIARKIGGNPQLVRTAALYHDIGKTVNPIYFTENQSGGINPHDQLTCIESASMIISHVTEGLKLADKYNLPAMLRDFIATHHGLGKAKYFYVQWKNEHPDEDIDELLFTYPGPNPFTKEHAILMMADAVEAASRSLPDYTEHSIRELVNRILDSQVSEGYFRECPITFRDISYAKTVLIEKLKTIYHTRISYPELKKN